LHISAHRHQALNVIAYAFPSPLKFSAVPMLCTPTAPDAVSELSGVANLLEQVTTLVNLNSHHLVIILGSPNFLQAHSAAYQPSIGAHSLYRRKA
jgi:hypothetical protein